MRKYAKLNAHFALLLNCLFIVLNEAARLQAPTPPSRALVSRQGNKVRQNGICSNQTPGDFVEHPENCRYFYVCMESGQAVVAACPSIMLFNPESRLCDSPDNVRCRTTTVVTTSDATSTSTAPTIATTPIDVAANELADATRHCQTLPPQQELDRITFIGSSSSCQRYYICYYGQAILQECSANLHWNANIGKCDLPANADCRLPDNLPNNGSNNGGAGNDNGNGSGSGSGNGNGSNNNNNNDGSGTGIDHFINCPNYGQHIFPHMGRCDIFIYCVKGHAALQQCPFYYHFDIVTKSCKWRTQALCVRDLNINFRK